MLQQQNHHALYRQQHFQPTVKLIIEFISLDPTYLHTKSTKWPFQLPAEQKPTENSTQL